MKRISFLAIVLASCGFLGTASAGVLPGKADSDCAKARKAGRACQLVFSEGDTLDGDRPSGDGDNIAVASPVHFSSLIRVRTSFRDLIIKTAEEY